jgi:hypothetical protein
MTHAKTQSAKFGETGKYFSLLCVLGGLARKDFLEVVLSNIASESMNDPVTLALVFVGGAALGHSLVGRRSVSCAKAHSAGYLSST